MEQILTQRQKNEIEYHKHHAEKNNTIRGQAVDLDVIHNDKRRTWNHYWSLYDKLLSHKLDGLNVLVPGCGFGNDAVRLAQMGANVFAFDISPDVIQICQERKKTFGYDNIEFSVMPFEKMSYNSNTFDLVFLLDVLHHVDITLACAEIQRVAKPEAHLIGDELYTHSAVQKWFRQSWLVDRVLYPLMHNYIYGSEGSYITDDEDKIDEQDFSVISGICSEIHTDYFNILTNRIFPEKYVPISKLDRRLSKASRGVSRCVAGRVLFQGKLMK